MNTHNDTMYSININIQDININICPLDGGGGEGVGGGAASGLFPLVSNRVTGPKSTKDKNNKQQH